MNEERTKQIMRIRRMRMAIISLLIADIAIGCAQVATGTWIWAIPTFIVALIAVMVIFFYRPPQI